MVRISLIIVEGADGTGKTTFIEMLKKAGAIVFHGKRVRKNPTEDTPELRLRIEGRTKLLQEFLIETKLCQDTMVVVDRDYVSEMVYAHVFKRKINHKFYENVDKKYSKMGAVIVYLDSTDEELKKRRPDDYQNLSKVRESYEKFMGWTACKVLRYKT